MEERKKVKNYILLDCKGTKVSLYVMPKSMSINNETQKDIS